MCNLNNSKTINSIDTKSNACQINNETFHYNLINKKLKKHPYKYLDTYTDSVRQTLDAFIYLSEKYGVIYLEQPKIAALAGVSVKSLIAAIKILVKDGLLAKVKRSWEQTCVYRLSNFFKEEWVKRRLVGFFKKSIILPVAFLLSFFQKPVQLENYRLLKEGKEYLLINNRHSVKERGLKNVVVKKKIRNRSWSESVKIKDDIFGEIGKITRMELTKRGIVELTKYDPRAIAHANKELNISSASIRNPFRWFCKLANEISAANDWPMNCEFYNRLIKLSNFKDDEPMFETTTFKPTRLIMGTPMRRTSNTVELVRPKSGSYSIYEEEENKIDTDTEKEKFFSGKTKGLTSDGEKFLEFTGLKR